MDAPKRGRHAEHLSANLPRTLPPSVTRAEGVAQQLDVDHGSALFASSTIEKKFGDIVAVAGVDLDVLDGEFFSMLGPSGSGKTTTLRMIAGFELPTSGRIVAAWQET